MTLVTTQKRQMFITGQIGRCKGWTSMIQRAYSIEVYTIVTHVMAKIS
jgi:hypothetical protein